MSSSYLDWQQSYKAGTDFSFLEMPLELRKMIYKEALKGLYHIHLDNPILTPCSSGCAAGTKGAADRHNRLSLLGTCKQIFAEAFSILCEESNFIFVMDSTHGWNVDRSDSFIDTWAERHQLLNVVPKLYRLRFQEISVVHRFPRGDPAGDDGYDNAEFGVWDYYPTPSNVLTFLLDYGQKILPRFPKVKKLTLVAECDPKWWADRAWQLVTRGLARDPPSGTKAVDESQEEYATRLADWMYLNWTIKQKFLSDCLGKNTRLASVVDLWIFTNEEAIEPFCRGVVAGIEWDHEGFNRGFRLAKDRYG